MLVDKSYRKDFHQKIDGFVPLEVILKRNKEKSWTYGRDAEHDLVVISKDGTIGDILLINGLHIALPSKPIEIRKTNLQQKDQKWSRYKVPDDLAYFDKFYGKEENVDSIIAGLYKKHKDYIDDDVKKIFNGDFFMNDGQVIYVTGFYYFFLQHYKLTDMRRYADFRMPQRDYFIWLEACIADGESLGSILLKSRRSSFSVTAAAIIICIAIFSFGGFLPIVSKNESTAKDLFAKHIVKPFLNLPKHLQPQRVGEVMPKTELYFSSPKKKLTANNKGNTGSEGLDTLIKFYPTTLDAYDSTQVLCSINDEIGKFKGNLDVNVFWDQAHKLCHIVGGEVVGKAICGSTANPPAAGGRNYEIFYNESKLSTKDSTGFTKTGLYSIFVPADFTTYGFFDEWGYVIYYDPNIPILNEIGKIKSIGVKRYLDEKEISCGKNLQKLNTQKRNHPRKDTDAFLDEDASTMFATAGLVSNLNFLKKFQYNEKYKTQVFRFDLSWEKGIVDGDVKMKRSSTGRFECSWLPPIETRNKFKEVNGKKHPINTDIGAFGCDPYQASRVAFGTGSMQGLIGITTENPYKLSESERDKMFIYYNARPDKIEDAIEDIIMIIKYCSMPILIEINKDSAAKKLRERGYGKYILNNPLKTKSELAGLEESLGGIYSHATNIPNQEHALQSFITDVLDEDVDEDNLKVPFIGALSDAEIYKTADRQKRDVSVAWGYAVLATRRKIKKVEKPTNTEPQKIYQLFLN